MVCKIPEGYNRRWGHFLEQTYEWYDCLLQNVRLFNNAQSVNLRYIGYVCMVRDRGIGLTIWYIYCSKMLKLEYMYIICFTLKKKICHYSLNQEQQFIIWWTLVIVTMRMYIVNLRDRCICVALWVWTGGNWNNWFGSMYNIPFPVYSIFPGVALGACSDAHYVQSCMS